MDDSGSRKSRILLIEDNPGDVDLLQLALHHAQVSFELQVFHLGGDALAFIQQQSGHQHGAAPDLAVIDLNLPQNDGLEILEAMRGSPRFSDIPVVVFSSSSLPREQARLEELHVRHYIPKPADLDKLLEIGALFKQLLAERDDG